METDEYGTMELQATEGIVEVWSMGDLLALRATEASHVAYVFFSKPDVRGLILALQSALQGMGEERVEPTAAAGVLRRSL